MRILKRIKSRSLRLAAILFGCVLLFLILVIVFISPIAKYQIEKHGEGIIGRKIKMDWLFLNPFSGAVMANNITIYEKGSTETAINVGSLSANVTIYKLLSRTYEVSSLTLNRLTVNVIQDSAHINFDDWWMKDSTKKKEPVKFRLCNIEIKNSEIHYRQLTIPVAYYIKNVSLKCPELQWDSDTMRVAYYFESGTGTGTVAGNIGINSRDTTYDLITVIRDFDLKVLEQYMEDFSDYATFSAFMNADIHSTGNFNNKMEMMTTGDLSIHDFHFGRIDEEDYASFKKFSMKIDSLLPSHKKYFLSSLLLDSAFVKYYKYDYLDNFSRMFGEKGSMVKEAYGSHKKINIIFLIADYLAELAGNLINSDYRINELTISNSKLMFNDYSLLQQFSATTDSIAITAIDLDSRKKRSFITLKSRMIPFGKLDVGLDINPAYFGDFNLHYSVSQVPLPVLNPYLVTYTSFPFNRGTMLVSGKWNVVNKQINSQNRLSIINASRVDKVKSKGNKYLPVPLALTLVRDWRRTIDFDIPITGSLDKPTYHLRDVIIDVIVNIFVKPPTYPIAASVQKSKVEQEERSIMEWMPMQLSITKEQEGQFEKISLFLRINPKSNLIISPKCFTYLEKEAILLYEAKKKYLANAGQINLTPLSEKDSMSIITMSIKDSSFVRYLNKQTDPDENEYSVFEKCRLLIGNDLVGKKYEALLARRKMEILKHFTVAQQLNRITYNNVVSTIPATGFSHDDYVYQ